MKRKQQREYQFTLVVDGLDLMNADHANALYEAGCDDASPAQQSGRGYIGFDRQADSLMDAILSACADVRKADIGVEILRIDAEDLVSQADIGRRAGISRSRVNNYVSGLRGPGNFPAPVSNLLDGSPLWRWAEVARWLAAEGIIEDELAEEAEQIAFVNSMLEFRRQKKANAKLAREVMKVLG